MEKQSRAQACVVSFRRWSRNSFAAFNSMGKLIRMGVLSLSCSILALPGHSKESRDTLEIPPISQVQELDEVVVSAQLTPVLQSELMRIVQVITRKDIERSPVNDLAGLLQNVRGVDIRKRGTFGMQADVSIRGGTFDQTMVLLNGINLTDPQTGHHNLNVPVDIQSIERIEVLQGSGARQFGPNAFSGAINIITRQPGSQPLTLALEGGHHGFMAGNLTTGFSALGTHHFVSFQGMKTDGFIENTDFTASSIYYRGLMEVGNNTLDLQAAWSGKAFGANSFYTPRYAEQFEEIKAGLVSLQLIPRGKVNIRPWVYWRRHHDRFELFRNEAPSWYAGHNYHLSDVVGGGLNWTHPWRFGKSTLGLNYRMEHIYSTVLGEELDEPRMAKNTEGIFYTHSFSRSGISIMGEHSIYSGNFSLSAGTLAWFNPELDKGISLFPGLDAAWQFNPKMRLFGSLSRTLRLPTFTDLFYSGPTNLGNPDLFPEKAISAEAGIKGRSSGIDWEMATFRRWGKDLIDWVKSPGEEQWQSMNLTKVNFTGFEAGIKIPLGKASFSRLSPLNLSAHYTYMIADKSSGDFISFYVLDFLNHKADLRLDVMLSSRAGFTTNASWISREGGYMLFEDGEFSRFESFKPWWSIDARIYYRAGPVEMFAEATNILNQRTVSISNVPQPGLWIRGGIKTSIDFN